MTHGIRDDNIQATQLLNRSLNDIEAVILNTGVLFRFMAISAAYVSMY